MQQAKFSIGQIVHHRLFNYRGVIYDVDFKFLGSDEWYDQVARSRPPKNTPWYYVLVDDGEHQTYVAERNLEPDVSSEPIQHPLLDVYFSGVEKGHYVLRSKQN